MSMTEISSRSDTQGGTVQLERVAEPIDAPTLHDEFLQTACTIARGRAAWSPGPGHRTEDLPWLKGATAA